MTGRLAPVSPAGRWSTLPASSFSSGYQATTIDAISDRSEVRAATVYRLFSSKVGILKALLDLSIDGDDQALSMQGPQVAALFAEPDPEKLVAGFASIAVAINARSSDVYSILSSASGSDPTAAALLADYQQSETTAKGGLSARLHTPAHSNPACENATWQTLCMRSCPLRSTGCSSSIEAGRRSATNGGSQETLADQLTAPLPRRPRSAQQ